MDIRQLAHEIQEYVVAFRRELHKHPEESLKEFRTTDRVAEELDKLGVPYRRTDPTGLIAEITGTAGASGKIVMLRGDMDALSLQENTGLPFASENPGFMHACGHDTHTAMLLGAAKLLSGLKDCFAGTVRLLFQPAEEVAKGADLMIEQGAMEGVGMGMGIHIYPLNAVGELMTRPGYQFAATDQFIIRVKGKGCHGAGPHQGIDATYAAASIIVNLQTMVSREFDPITPLVVTVGSCHSGSRFNIVSGEAVMEGTCRSFDRAVYAALPEVMSRIAKNVAAGLRCEAEVEFIRLTQPLINDAHAVELGKRAAAKILKDPSLLTESPISMGGEDFASFTALAPCAFFQLGAGGPDSYPQHSDRVCYDEESFETGVAMYVQFALDALEELNG